MLALYRSGRQADALEAYQDARRTLDRELGIEPGPALRELERKILNQDESLARAAPAPPADASGVGAAGGPSSSRARSSSSSAAVAAALQATRESAAIVRGPAELVGAIDPERNAPSRRIPVGTRPGAVAVGAGSVWVGEPRGPEPHAGSIRRRSGRRAPCRSATVRRPALRSAPGAVWVAHGLGGELVARRSRT